MLRVIQDMPISFEVFSDDIGEMARQARTIAAWGKNVYVKIPVTNTLGQSTASIIAELSREGIRLNITALLSLSQVRHVCDALDGGLPRSCRFSPAESLSTKDAIPSDDARSR